MQAGRKSDVNKITHFLVCKRPMFCRLLENKPTIALSFSLCDVTSPLARNKKKKKRKPPKVLNTQARTHGQREMEEFQHTRGAEP